MDEVYNFIIRVGVSMVSEVIFGFKLIDNRKLLLKKEILISFSSKK